MIWSRIGQANILLSLLFSRVLFASVVLSILIVLIMLARKNNLEPAIRSYLWAFCIPALFIPFERSIVILMQGQALELNLILFVCIWLLGFFIYVVKTLIERVKTIRLIKAGAIKGGAAYFYRFRSHIYTPPNFNDTYTAEERAMLLAHEQQHIKQRDPLLFLFLQGLQCVFWFNPLIHRAVRYIRHDRELLCDERVISRYPKLDYGKLLINEASKALPVYDIAGISSSTTGIYERIIALTRPFSKNKKTTITVVIIAAFLFLAGAIGFTKPMVYHPMETMIVRENDFSRTHIEGFEKFVTHCQGNIIISEGLYLYAAAKGFETDDRLGLVVLQVRRPSVFATSVISRGFSFTLGDLKNGEIVFPHHYVSYDLRSFWGVLYRIL
ncbi:MAG: hypothetical protein FWB80_04805 [Defluviitaleaceae bacterium]|nr:hypothetical protein [Defluviitaleaceae bacterium]